MPFPPPRAVWTQSRGWLTPGPYETIVVGRRVNRVVPRERLRPTTREWARFTTLEAGKASRQRLLLGGRTDLLASARPIKRLLSSDRPSGGAGIDWPAKLARLRQTQRSFQIGYRGPGTLGPRPLHASDVGQKVWEHVQQQKQVQARVARLRSGAERLGSCYGTTVQRMLKGWEAARGVPLLAGKSDEQKTIFDAIAGTRYGTLPQAWKKVPKNLRFRGVPGALAYLNVAKVVDTGGVWRGELEPGAPLQFWSPGWGHSAVLERYIRDKQGRVVGLVYSDQWKDYKVQMRPRKGDVNAPRIYGAKFATRAR